MEYRKISTVLKRYSFEQKMNISHEYSIPWVNGVDESLARTGWPLPWELEAFVLLSIISREWYSNSFDGRNQHVFLDIISCIRKYIPPKISASVGTPALIKYFAISAGLTQLEIQENHIYKLFRYNYFFNFSKTELICQLCSAKKLDAATKKYFLLYWVYCYLIVYSKKASPQKNLPHYTDYIQK